MIVQARRYRRAARAFLASGGKMSKLREATHCSHSEIGRFLSGELGFITAGKARRIESLFSKPVRDWVQGSPQFEVAVGQVPCALVAPLIAESFAKYGRERTASIVGTSTRQLFGVAGERQAVNFDIADMIVSRLASPGWWLETDER